MKHPSVRRAIALALGVGFGTANAGNALNGTTFDLKPPVEAGPTQPIVIGDLPIKVDPGYESPADPVGIVYMGTFDGARPTNVKSYRLPKDAVSRVRGGKKSEQPLPERTPEKIHPLLLKWLQERPGELEMLVINFRDDVEIPRFPIPRTDQPRGSAENKRLLAAAEQIVEGIQQERAATYEKLAEELRGGYGVRVEDQFWLVNGMVAEVLLDDVLEIAKRDDVLYIEPVQTEDRPPANEVFDGRKLIVSDPYFNLGLNSGWIGLLDTGLRFSHVQFNSPAQVALKFDCTDGVCNAIPDPSDDCWNHGTSSAGILVANSNQGNLFRGVTDIKLDSFKVYPAGCGGLNTTASVKAFEKAVAVLDRVIVAEMQGSGGINSAITTAADNAFDAGAVVIAANGNFGPGGGTVRSPANGHKVLGIGNFDVATLTQINGQSRGPTSDNRFKPDIQAPTKTRTASSASDTAIKTFSGTSGATPYAAGAAALMRNWLRNYAGNIDPGQVYAHMILTGQTPYPFNNTSGAGRIVMPTGGHAWWGKVAVGTGMNIDIPISVGPGKTKIEGALWWPESSSQSHNDVDLYLIDPAGNVRDLSWSIPSVFERARYASGSLATGTWKIRIRGYSVPTGGQTVYWGARTR